MEYRVLEITVQYAKDLKKVNLITKMDVYAIISVSSRDNTSSNQTIKTPVDLHGNANPTWNFPITYTVDEVALQHNCLMLDFQIICNRALGDKHIGELHVPVKELFDTPAKGSVSGKSFVSYHVLKPSGKPKGSITFSYKFGQKISVGPVEPSAPPLDQQDHVEPVVMYSVGPSNGYMSYQVANEGGVTPAVPQGYGYNPTPSYGGAPVYPPGPPPYGHGYYSPVPQPGYGYLVQPTGKKSKLGLELGAGLLGGTIGGLLMGDLIF